MTPPAYSRPFRSFTVFLIVWVTIRAVMLWHGTVPHKDPDAKPDVLHAQRVQVRPAIPSAIHQFVLPQIGAHLKTSHAITAMQVARPRFASHTRPVGITSNYQRVQATTTVTETNQRVQTAASIRPISARVEDVGVEREDARTRWSASAWLLSRRDGPAALGTAGELGGSQVGMRAYFEMDRPIAATLRVSRPLSRAQGGEASVGIALRHRNIGLLLERRIALDRGGRNDVTVTTYGGFSDMTVGTDLRLDGYAQAGLVGKDRFADGALRIERTVATVQQTRISVGTGLWGGAQPGVARLDIGPQIVARVPVEDSTLRLSAEWRERIAGDAAPDSGPSITIGIDL